MNAAALEIPPVLRSLVDNRLDTIERALMQGNTPRAERRSILEDIETQILEMLSAETAGHEPTRADLLRVFTKLDPPEAFAGEQAEMPKSARASRCAAPSFAPVPPVSKPTYSTVGILACVGGLVTLMLGLPVAALTLMFGEDEFLTLMVAGFVAFSGLPSLVLGILYAIALRQSQGRLRGLTCAAIGISALPICVVGLLGGFLALASEAAVAIVGFGAIICTFAVVGAIHLTYRCLDLFVGTQENLA
jgi:hypothetical protein